MRVGRTVEADCGAAAIACVVVGTGAVGQVEMVVKGWLSVLRASPRFGRSFACGAVAVCGFDSVELFELGIVACVQEVFCRTIVGTSTLTNSSVDIKSGSRLMLAHKVPASLLRSNGLLVKRCRPAGDMP